MTAGALRSMRGVARALAPLAAAMTVGFALACADINTDPKSVASIGLDTLSEPAVVAHDSLRDTLGIVRPLHATAYNPQDAALTDVPVRFLALDPGVFVDSAAGYVVGDTARSTPVRIIAQAGGLQTMADTIFVVPAPDSIAAQNPADTLQYSLSDSTANVSTGLTVLVAHRNGTATPAPVRGWLVSYRIVAPTDTLLAQLVGDNGRTARVATTASDGTASRRVRIRPGRLPGSTDSVIVEAMVRYLGAPITGAPLRFVLQVKPRS